MFRVLFALYALLSLPILAFAQQRVTVTVDQRVPRTAVPVYAPPPPPVILPAAVYELPPVYFAPVQYAAPMPVAAPVYYAAPVGPREYEVKYGPFGFRRSVKYKW